MHNVLDETRTSNAGEPMWLVLHRPVGAPQRRRWGQDVKHLVDDLVEKYGWVLWHEGREAHVKHRSLMAH